MQSSSSDPIHFVAPGLVHQFGNLLLTMQGHALVLEAGPHAPGRAREAIGNACRRGAAALRVLRCLLGEDDGSHATVDELSEVVTDLVRVPVREAGPRLELSVSPDVAAWLVPVAPFTASVVHAVGALVGALPKGIGGRVRVTFAPAPGSVRIDARFVGESGNLPFPVPIALVQAAFGAAATQHASTVASEPLADGLRLSLTAQAMGGEACQDLHEVLPDGP